MKQGSQRKQNVVLLYGLSEAIQPHRHSAVADKIKLSVPQLSRLVNLKQGASLDVALRLADALIVPVEKLVGKKPPENNPETADNAIDNGAIA